MAQDTKLACNRAPFETTSSCDRGDVDITVFAGLPLCESIDPPPSIWGPPTFDFPIVPFAPPPCACINIETTAIGVAEERSDIEFKVDFKADSDCCEGNYTADVDIKIPCIPFEIIGGSKGNPIDIETVCSPDMSPEGIINLGLRADSSCNIIVEPKVSLKIPRPPRLEFANEISIETICGLPEAEGSFTIESSGSCDKQFINKLSLRIPRPPKYSFDTELNIETVCGLGSAIGAFSIESDSLDDCDRTVKARLNLQIPKPRTYKFDTNFNIATICGLSSAFGYFIIESYEGQNSSDKTRTGGMTSRSARGAGGAGGAETGSGTNDCVSNVVASLGLAIPKPPKYSFDTEFSVETICGLESAIGLVHKESSYGDCERNVKTNISLKVPKPIKYSFDTDLNIKVVCPGKDRDISGTFLVDEEGSTCTRNVLSRLDIDVPCILFDISGADEEKDIEIETECNYTAYKPTGTIDLGLKVDCCTLKFDPKVTLNLPVPPTYDIDLGYGFKEVCDIKDAYAVTITENKEDVIECNRHILHKKYEIKVPHHAKLNVNGETKEVPISGIGGTGKFSMGVTNDKCGYPVSINPWLTLDIPCPLDALHIYGDSSEDSGKPFISTRKLSLTSAYKKKETGNVNNRRDGGGIGGIDGLGGQDDLGGIDDLGGFDWFDGSEDLDDCEASWGIHLVWPDTYTGTIKFLKGIKFNGKSFEAVVGHATFKYGLCIDADSSGSPIVDIPTSKHVNKCCDVDAIQGIYDHDTGADAPDGEE